VVMNASPSATMARARALLEDWPPLGANQQSSVLQFAGNRALKLGNPAAAAHLLEQRWTLVPSPARGLKAAWSWLAAGDPTAAERLLDRVRARGGLEGGFRADADSLAARLARSRSGT